MMIMAADNRAKTSSIDFAPAATAAAAASAAASADYRETLAAAALIHLFAAVSAVEMPPSLSPTALFPCE